MPKKRRGQTILIDLEKLNSLNKDGCPACGRKFNLGDQAVWACGAWEGGARLIHEQDAVFDARTNGFVERKCYSAGSGRIP